MSLKRVASLALLGALLGVIVGSAVAQDVPGGCACTNNPPDNEFTCDEQKGFGKCADQWMIDGNYCEFSCERCTCDDDEDPVLEEEPAVVKPDEDEEDAADEPIDADEDEDEEDEDDEKPARAKAPQDADEDEDEDEEEEDDDAEEEEEEDPVAAEDATDETVDGEKVPLRKLVDGKKNCKNTLFSALDQAEETTTLASLISSLGLEDDLDTDTAKFTVFAPTNEAIDAFLIATNITPEALLTQHADAATTLISYHVAPGAISKAKLANSAEIPTLVKDAPLFGGSGSEIDGLGSSAKIIGIPTPICQSIVYLIDTVLIPAKSLEELIGPDEEEPEEPEEEEVSCDAAFNGFFAVSEEDDLGTLENLLNELQLSGALADPEEEYTLFAPTDAAFEAAAEQLGTTVDALSEDPDTLLGIMQYHILPKNMEASDLLELGSGNLKTENKTEIILEVNGGRIDLFGTGSSASVIDGDIDQSCLSAVHKVDGVLLPFKVGDHLAVRGSTAQSQVPAKSGKPPKKDQKASSSCQVGTQSAFDVLSRQSDLRVFTQILRQANLQPILTNKDLAVTIFAPVDFAFGNILPQGKGFFDLVPDVELAQKLISYHLGGTPAPKRLLKDGFKISTGLAVRDTPLTLEVAEDPLSFPLGLTIEAAASSANFTQLDVFACNSVIHKIDTVLLPEEEFLPSSSVTVAEALDTAADFESLLSAPKEDEGEEDPDTKTSRSG